MNWPIRISANPKFTNWLGTKFAAYLARHVKMNPAGWATVLGIARGQAAPKFEDEAANQKLSGREPWVRSCERLVGSQFGSVPLVVQRQERIKGELKWIEQTEGRLYELLQRPNPEYGLFQLLWKSSLSIDNTGDVYWLFDPKDFELWHCNSKYVNALPDANGSIVNYDVSWRGKSLTIPAENVIHIKYPNEEEEFYGMSLIKSLQVTALISSSHRQTINNFFRNGAQFGGMLTTDAPLDADATEAQAQAIRKQIDSTYVGFENFWKLFVAGNGLKFEQTTPPFKELVADDLREMTVEEICSVLQVPPPMVGYLRRATYSNYQTAEQIFWTLNILPRYRLFSEEISLQLIPRIEDVSRSKMRVIFDTKGISALQEDTAKVTTNATNLYKSGVITRNESREMVGLDPVENGDDFYTAPLPEAFRRTDTTPPPAKSIKMLPDLRKIRKDIKAEDYRAILLDIHEKRLTKNEAEFGDDIRDLWRDQLGRVLDNLSKVTFKGEWMVLLRPIVTARKDKEDNAANSLFDKDAEKKLLIEKLGPAVKRVVKGAGYEAVAQWDLATDFNINNPKVQVALNQMVNRISYINDTTWEELKDLLKTAYDEEWSIAKAEQEIRGMFIYWSDGETISKSRATRIARTEINGMVNGGEHLAFEQAKVEKKEWLATRDALTRDTHILADSQKIGLNEKFSVGNDMLDYPGDANGSPEEVVNCRCTVIPVIED